MKKAIFLDRDGVINKGTKVTSSEGFVLANENVPAAIKKINGSGYLAIMITNQPIIAKGFTTFGGLEKIHEKMNRLLEAKGAKLDAIYVCPHHPEKGFEGEAKELKIDCDCRKPKPGMLLKAAKEHNIDLSKSWIIGDDERDIDAGKAAGVKTILISAAATETKADLVKRSLLEAVEAVLDG